ncbi:hypothetical protein [Sutterella sp.]|uniref:hypothetical protein n=1 Tax=Sutterella sp. TaxID=1981025 RepID=UPI0026DFC594|nr:hypothetical protein [Sutterella sp.]MDO5532674.1 hypothetical protein [Sutterella sp.]
MDKYLSALLEAQLFLKAPRLDIRKKRVIGRSSKYWPVDPALGRTMPGSRS